VYGLYDGPHMNSSSAAAVAVFDSLMQKWIQAQIDSDPHRLATLYTPDAMFFGSKAKLYRGREGVVEYLTGFPKNVLADVVLHERYAMQLATDVIAVSFFLDFHVNGEGKVTVMPWRAIFTLKRESDGEWRIATHHASPKEPK
jgi:uncharacterized protein (TIGR02246 family)